MSSSHLTGGEAKTWQEPSQTADKSLATGTYFQEVGGKCLGARLPTSDFSWILGEPRVSGTCFSKHAEKGPTGIYLITISRCITLASIRQLLNVLISCPAGRKAGQEGRQHPPCHHPEGLCDKQVSQGRMVVKALCACLRHFPQQTSRESFLVSVPCEPSAAPCDSCQKSGLPEEVTLGFTW